MSNHIKHVFPGGNTTQGFYSFYEYILSQKEANHIFCLKGGPGVGKSSFMKKIGKKFFDLGYNVEFHHCSSDPNSLDGIVIEELKIAMIDGTSPHIVDPKNPGAVDEIINLGEYWDEVGMKKNKDQVINTNAEIGRLFNKAYNYLRSAKEIYDSYAKIENKAFNINEYNNIIRNLESDLFNQVQSKGELGNVRHLFGFALTPLGITEFRDSLINKYNIRYVVFDSPGASSEQLMSDIVNKAIKMGLYVEAYHSPIKVSKIEDILIPELSLSISVDNSYHKVNFEHNKGIDLIKLLDKDILESINDEIKEDKEIFEMLLYKAINYINKAKALHDKLEEYYIPNMNFEKVDHLLNKIIDRILALK